MHLNGMQLINHLRLGFEELLTLVEIKFCEIRLNSQFASHWTRLILPRHIQQGRSLMVTQMSELNDFGI